LPESNIASPAYVLEEEKLLHNLKQLAAVQEQAGVQIILALKAFAFWPVFPTVGRYLSGATASGLYEARLIFEEMGVRAHTYSPAYLPEDFPEIVRYSSHITFNAPAEYFRYRNQLQTEDHRVSAGLRVNPEYSPVETDLYNPASPTGRLGVVSLDELPAGIEGLHVHTLCECNAASSATLIERFEAKFGHFLPRLKWVNFGGGHLATRSGYATATLVNALRQFRERHPHLEVILEPGSAIAWQAGYLRSRVLDVIENAGVKTAILDVSFTAHMPDTLEMPYRPAVRGASKEPVAGWENYRLGGVSCLAGDYLDAYYFPQPLAAGDPLIFEDMFHYTTVKTTMFNGVRHPDLVIARGDGSTQVVRRFDYTDYKNRMG
jgi:carboxynorspermidine decarboxylase